MTVRNRRLDCDADAETTKEQSKARRDRGKFPVGSESRAKAAAKETWRSRQATRRVAKVKGGIRNRNNCKWNKGQL